MPLLFPAGSRTVYRGLVAQLSWWVFRHQHLYVCTPPGALFAQFCFFDVLGSWKDRPMRLRASGCLPNPTCASRVSRRSQCLWSPLGGGNVCLFCFQWQAFCFLHSLGKTCPLVFPFPKFPLTVGSQEPDQLGFAPGLGYGLTESCGTPASWHQPSWA